MQCKLNRSVKQLNATLNAITRCYYKMLLQNAMTNAIKNAITKCINYLLSCIYLFDKCFISLESTNAYNISTKLHFFQIVARNNR